MFSLSIDDFVFIHHESFRKLVDEFGGVTVDVARGMRYNDPLQGLHIDPRTRFPAARRRGGGRVCPVPQGSRREREVLRNR
jgi:anionic cell wall polymer biosynthesis LytR-Cps2A-Psr (LCP) family protein